eukprot:g28383.t1
MGISVFEIDIGVEVVTRDGDRGVQEGEGGIGDGPGEFEVGARGVSKVDELFKLLMGAQGSADTIINVMEDKMRDGAGVPVEKGLFQISYEEAGIARTCYLPLR